jgi:hypothetical protein
MKFLGVNYWSNLLHKDVTRTPPSPCLSSQAQDFSSFVAALTALFSSKHHIATLPSNSILLPSCSSSSSSSSPSTSQDKEIVENGGIYTYRHQMSVGQARSKAHKVVPLHSPIDHILQETFTSTESRRFPHTKHHCTSALGRASVSDMRKELHHAASSMVGLKMLIIEDSKLQRKMMHHQLSKVDSVKDRSPESSVFNFEASEESLSPLSSDAPEALKSAAKEERGEAVREWTVKEACNGEEANYSNCFMSTPLCFIKYEIYAYSSFMFTF